ncbi:succinate dehydrogenase / fumarate reductase cytochrome b subunit [Methylohalomonas lacus]|uniref:Succinate dehydrogenase cytochrome b556 subunit n=1 Tax=Methylohalomonas lacus TaxID=398773 RepID=A0AAE3L0Q2_9GAMM|nr:succinate dehydrogenase, cytochrome b556 subunit [Methylohalomonas lacus]MCS3902425.1 succinate dehydrogenase / fumarate reductase cytochrome b subunit [Methylohalomonas lacus]
MSARQRPLSPHLQVYKPQLTSVLSITHRGTGLFLSLGALVLCYWLLALAAGPDSYANAQAVIGSWPGQLLLFGWVAALYYHLANGIRHLFWDAGYGLELKTTYASGFAVVAVSIVLTVATWIIAALRMGGGA